MKPKVSVVVPIYNVEKYLFRCLESLAKQSLEELQVICVNDGSQDNSQSIIDEFVKKYPNKFICVKKINGGLSDARNAGLPYCEAEYIGFLDSDDYVDLQHFEILYNSAINNNSDLVVCDILYEWEDKHKTHRLKGYFGEQTNLNPKLLFLSPLFAWNKLYRRELFSKYEFKYPFGLWYEDIPVSIPLFSLIEKFSVVTNTAVHYMQRSQSIMNTTSNPKMQDIFKVLELTLYYFNQKGSTIKYRNELEYLTIEQLMLYGSFRAFRSTMMEELMLKSFIFIEQNFPNWKRNQYLKELPLKYQIYLNVLNRNNFRFLASFVRSFK